ncbi:nitroreductase family protein [Anaerotignum faecicola]|nr:nitroreductase family protein [Anaerotignum faecicola]
MDLKEAIYGRRSVRRYNDKPISDIDISEIMEAACWAPSAVNLQPWYFVVCRSSESMKKLSRIMDGSIFGLKKVLNNRFKSHPEVINETVDFVKSLGGAKVCILTFLQQEHYDEELAAVESAAAAMQNIVLTAYSKGISSCWLTAPLHVENELREAFAPGKGRLIAAITLGYSDAETKAPKRKEGRVTVI